MAFSKGLRMYNPLVTVLIPTYNVEKYIEECFDSILNQTFQDFEILVIDDASTDNTVKIIESIGDSRIKILKKEKNKGLIDSLNIGFESCKGKYIARVDGDDVNDVTRFEKQFIFLENNLDIDACGSWLQAFGESNNLIKHKETHEEIMCAMFHTAPMSLGATMLRRKAYKGILFDTTMLHAEDYDFWARTGYTNKMHNLQEVLYFYRTHQEQVCLKYRPIQLQNKALIKLALWKKLGYNQQLFSDEFLVKMLTSNKDYSFNDFVMLKQWIKQIIENNKTLGIYNPNHLNATLKQIIENILYNTYKTNKRNVSKYTRVKLFKVISINWIVIGIISSIKLKLKFFFKQNKIFN